MRSSSFGSCSCKELGGTPDLESSLRLSCKAPRLVFGMNTLIPKSAIIRTTSYGTRVRARFKGTSSSLIELVTLQSSQGSEMLGAVPAVRDCAPRTIVRYMISNYLHVSIS
ncbi:hypothetical protein SLEP1_g20878 [Rubroshorea leprosula]|uniref:Uncharacterized protein n=1 Tax=Rubroshorea leprosula TaxID=152421 RepID=A0AAV5JDB1_9ROSI|nr:hypothetical protein SLEP1_g20878 [Rubroshorea leprosula]